MPCFFTVVDVHQSCYAYFIPNGQSLYVFVVCAYVHANVYSLKYHIANYLEMKGVEYNILPTIVNRPTSIRILLR